MQRQSYNFKLRKISYFVFRISYFVLSPSLVPDRTMSLKLSLKCKVGILLFMAICKILWSGQKYSFSKITNDRTFTCPRLQIDNFGEQPKYHHFNLSFQIQTDSSSNSSQYIEMLSLEFSNGRVTFARYTIFIFHLGGGNNTA